jgi:adenine phosphoribosyltransferase
MEHKYFKYIESFKDFPKKGVIFWDFTPLLDDPVAFKNSIKDIRNHFKKDKITKIASIESKGFTLGSALAYEMKKPLILIRKPLLIPGKVLSEKFTKEYGEGEYQIKQNAVNKKDRVLIIYDIMAGSGATKAAITLLEKQGAKVIGCAYVIELEYLKGREDLRRYKLFPLVKISKKKLK